MQLSAGHVAELCDELTDLLRGWVIKDVQGLPPRDVLLVFAPAPGGETRGTEPDPKSRRESRAEGARDARLLFGSGSVPLVSPPGADTGPPVLRLRLSADPEAPRLHLQHGRVHRHSGPDGPFFRRLADELTGAELRSLTPVRGDRIALLELRTAAGRRGLLLELFGRHANMALLGPGDVVLELLAPARTKEGAPRLAPGAVWRAPDEGRTPRAEPPLVEAFPAPTAPPPGRDPERAPLSWRVETHLGVHAEEARDDTLRRDLRQRLKRRIERVDALLRGLAQKADAASELDRARHDAELLKASLGQLRRGQSEVELLDWFAPEPAPRRIELDPRRSPQENVERAFARIKKLERGAAQVDVERARAAGQHALLTELLGALEAEGPGQAGGDPVELEQRALDAGLLERRQEPDVRKRKAPAPRRPYRTFVALSGAEIRVGRNAKDNDELTLRHTRGNDLWLHTADVPGSHVVLRLEHGAEAQDEDVLDAATLAVHFSPARGRARVPVHVVHRKHVSKPKGAKPGLVQLAGGRSMTVRLDAERLERLLRGAAGGESGPDRGDPR